MKLIGIYKKSNSTWINQCTRPHMSFPTWHLNGRRWSPAMPALILTSQLYWYLKVTFVIYLSVRTVITGNYSMSMLYKTIVTNDGQIEAVASMLLLRALHALIVCHPCLTESWNLKQSWVQRHRICELRSYFLEQAARDDFDLKIKPPIPSHHPPMKANCQRFGSGRKITLCCIVTESGWYHATSKE